MSRRPRLEAPGAVHHVVVQAATGERIVRDDADRLRLLDELRVVALEYGWECGAHSVLDTHAHFLVRTAAPNLGDGMKLFLGRYTYTYNRRHDRRGHLLGRRYWSRRIDDPRHLRRAALYTVLNPNAAGLCAHPRDFAWCSYLETAGLIRPSGLVVPGVVLDVLHPEVQTARIIYRELVDDAVARLAVRRADEVWWRAVERAAAKTRETG